MGIFDDIGDAFSDAADAIGDVTGSLFGGAGGFFADMLASIAAPVVDVVETVTEPIVDVVDAIGDTTFGFADWLGGAAIDIGEGVGDFAVDAVDTAVDTAGDLVETVADTALDAGEGFVEGAGDVLEVGADVVGTVASLPGDAIDVVVDTGVDALGVVLEPVVGEEALDDLADTLKTAGRVAMTGGAAGVTALAQGAIANEAGDLVEDVAGEELGTVANFVARAGQGQDVFNALEGAGVDPRDAAADVFEEIAAPIIGEDGAVAAARFGRALTDAYGEEAAVGLQAGGMAASPSLNEQIIGMSTMNPLGTPSGASTGTGTPFEATYAQQQEITDAAKGLAAETIEAGAENIVGQEAAEDIGKYGVEIGYEVLKTTLTGGMSLAETGISAFRTGYEIAAGESLEQTIGSAVGDGLAPVLGDDAAAIVGKGLSIGLSSAFGALGSGEVPDLSDLGELDLESMQNAGAQLLGLGADGLIGGDPAAIQALGENLANGQLSLDDITTITNVASTLAPAEVQPYINATQQFVNGDPEAALHALVPALPTELQQAYADGSSLLDLANTDVADIPSLNDLPGLDDEDFELELGTPAQISDVDDEVHGLGLELPDEVLAGQRYQPLSPDDGGFDAGVDVAAPTHFAQAIDRADALESGFDDLFADLSAPGEPAADDLAAFDDSDATPADDWTTGELDEGEVPAFEAAEGDA